MGRDKTSGSPPAGTMPYGRRPTQVEPSSSAPGEIDFNALWDRAFAPTIQFLGYEPVRADQDTGAMIVTQMIERIYFADLVLADITIPNGNVYYNLGIRHASKEKGCVMLAADWSRQVFDIAQMRTIRYPLKEGNINDATASAISAAIRGPIEALARGNSPVYDAIRGYPNNVDPANASTMKDVMLEFAAFQGQIRSVRMLPRESRFQSAQHIAERYYRPPATLATVLALLRLLTDSAETKENWEWIIELLDRLPGSVAEVEEVREVYALALANLGRPIDAIAKIEALITLSGPTPWRFGSGRATNASMLDRRPPSKNRGISANASRPMKGEWSSI
jgi:hypothetical protein